MNSQINKYNVHTLLLTGALCIMLIMLSIEYNRLIDYKESLLCLQEYHSNYINQLQTEYGMQDAQELLSGTILHPYQMKTISLPVIEQCFKGIASAQSKNPSVPKAIQSITNKKNDFMWPIKHDNFWLSSNYGMRKKKDGSQRFHRGIDLAALKGTAVCSAQAGVVYQTGYSPKGYGKYVKIKHQKGYETRYAHLSAIMVNKGQHIHKGMIIGKVGSTGAVWGKNASHLHFEVLAFSQHVNPLSVLQ